jgi:hypothetical protein
MLSSVDVEITERKLETLEMAVGVKHGDKIF